MFAFSFGNLTDKQVSCAYTPVPVCVSLNLSHTALIYKLFTLTLSAHDLQAKRKKKTTTIKYTIKA